LSRREGIANPIAVSDGWIIESGDLLLRKRASIDAKIIYLAVPAVAAKRGISDAEKTGDWSAGTGVELRELRAVVVIDPRAPRRAIEEIDQREQMPLTIV
jgi:hypothetical protein